MSEKTPATDATVEPKESKIKDLAKKYWKPVAVGAAATAAAVVAVVAIRNNKDEDEIFGTEDPMFDAAVQELIDSETNK